MEANSLYNSALFIANAAPKTINLFYLSADKILQMNYTVIKFKKYQVINTREFSNIIIIL